jgi:hypothetical protein
VQNRSARTASWAGAVAAVVALLSAAPAQAAPPPNDAFAAAAQLPTPASVPGTTAEAGKEPGEPDWENERSIYGDFGVFGDGSVWYSWTAPHSSRFRVAHCGTPEQRHIAVFTGSSLGELQPVPDATVDPDREDVGCAAGDPNGAAFLFDAIAGTTYRIAIIDSFIGSGGPFQLTLDDRPAAVFDSAIQQTASRSSVRRGRRVTYTATLVNSGTVPIDEEWVQLIASKPGDLHGAVRKVRYISIESTRGTCERQTFFRRHKGAMCEIGRLAPGEKAVVTAVVKVRRSITHWALLDYAPGTGVPVFDDNRDNDESPVLTRATRRR